MSEPLAEPTNVTTHECSRCGGSHVELPIHRMQRPHAPPEAGGLEWTHWATCPKTGDPILILLTPQSPAQREAGVWYGGEGVRVDGPLAPANPEQLGSLVVTPTYSSTPGEERPHALAHIVASFSGSPGLQVRLSAGALLELVEFAVLRLGVPYPLDQLMVSALHDVRDNLRVLTEGDDVAPLRRVLTHLIAGRPR